MKNRKAFLEIAMYGLSLAVLLFALKWFEWRFTLYGHSFELFIGFVALLFTGVGVWLALKLAKPKMEQLIIEKAVYLSRPDDFEPDNQMIAQLDLSKRELEILALMAIGLSNDEIAEQLCVSLSTIKSHNQNIFAKLDVKRRTQAVDKARKLNIIC